ncbi:hypothetical protein [Actinokineospora enzanensis]|uniref:hypothetical protein n=1 Tax=Actinokineospora enzanensis TaxID=155975 RepID=UPI0003A32943|nr:hypothetical protein [Actinokineospora enzanensis]
MTDDFRGTGPDGPPWSVDLLASLHAGVLDSERSARLWPRVNADPAAKAVIDALDSVKVGLGELGQAPVAPMPAQFAARLDSALEAEARRAFGGPVAIQERNTPPHPVAPAPRAPQRPQPLQTPPQPPQQGEVVDLAAARRKRNRLQQWGIGVLAAAAAAVAVGYIVLPGNQNTTGGQAEAPPNLPSATTGPGGQGEGPIAVRREDFLSVIGRVTSKWDYGPLKDEAGVTRCLAANHLDPAKTKPAGVHPVTLDGKPGVLVLMVPGDPGRFRVLVVEADCTALANESIG